MTGLSFRMFRIDRIENGGTMHGVQVQLVIEELRTELGMLIQVKQGRLSPTTATENGVALDEERLLFIAGGQDNAVDEDVDEQHVQDLALNVDNVFQADECDAFDSDVDEAPTTQTVFMANLSSVDPVYDKVGPSYDSNILYEKTCKTRITPTGLTEGERGFEQTKECYLTEVILFLETLKEYFKGIQKALTKEIKEKKAIFDELEAEADQNVVNRKYSITSKVLTPGMYAIDAKPILPHIRNNREVYLDYLKHLKESVKTLREIVKEAKVEITLDRSLASDCLYTKHSQELLEYVIGTCPKDINKRDKEQATTLLTSKKQVTFVDHYEASNNNTHKHEQYQENGISPAASVNRKTIKDHPRTNKSNLQKSNRVGSSISSKSCSRHMTRDRLRLKNFMKKFIETDRFGNNHFSAIMGYGDYMIGDSVISRDLVRGLPRLKFEKDHLCSACQLGKSKKHTHSPKTKNTNLEVLNTLHMDLYGPMRVQTINGKKYILVIIDDYMRFTWVKFLRSKDETLKVVIKFLKQIQVSLNKTVRFIYTDNGTEFVNHDLTYYYESVGIFHQKSVSRTPQQNDVVKRGNHTLVEAARAMLVVSKALIEDLGKLQPTADIGIFYRTRSYISDAWTDKFRTRTKSGSCSSLCTFTNKELEILFQSMFDEYLEPPHVERPVSPSPTVPVPVNSVGTPSSTSIDQDAPSPSHSPPSSALQSLCLHQGVTTKSTLMDENLFAPVDNDPFINIFALEPNSEASSSRDASSAESTYVTQTIHRLRK
nr:ribonuclease H-like domain-containing protein [Tanacetum cinerariifolium]